MRIAQPLFTLLSVLALVGAGAAANANQLESIKKAGTISIGVDIGQAPFGMVNGEMKQVGSDVETAQLVAKDLGVKLNIVPVSPANRIPYLMTNKVNVVIASFSITEERRKTIDFSVPYAVIQSAVATTGGLKISGLKDLENKEVAVTRGSTNDQLITKAIAETGLKDVKVVRYDDNAAATNAILSGQQAIYIVAPSLLAPVNAANPSRKIEPQLTLQTFPLGLGLRKNEPEFKAWLDKWVSDNLSNGKLRTIYKTHHGVDLPAQLPTN